MLHELLGNTIRLFFPSRNTVEINAQGDGAVSVNPETDHISRSIHEHIEAAVEVGVEGAAAAHIRFG
jgi:hypothetical protein